MPPFLGAVLDFIFGRSVVVEKIIQNSTVHDAEMARLRKEVEAANKDRDEMLRKHNELSVESEQMRNRWAQNERQLQDFKATHDMQLEENKRSFERMTIEANAQMEKKRAEWEAQAQKLQRDAQRHQELSLEREKKLKAELSARQSQHDRELMIAHQKMIDSANKSEAERKQALEEYNFLVQSKQATLDDLAELKKVADQKVEKGSNICVSARQATIESSSQFQHRIAENKGLFDQTKQAENSTSTHALKESSNLVENKERMSNQSMSSSGSAKANLQFARQLLGPLFPDMPHDVFQACCKKYSSLKSGVQTQFYGLGESMRKTPQASWGQQFVLGEGCSIVCPLIAFLNGSPCEDSRSGQCTGNKRGLQIPEHSKCTYLFRYDPSKLKVASFAPLQQ